MKLFLPVIEAFNRHGVSYVTVGGLATVLHGHVRMTADVDFVIELSAENIRRGLDAINELGMRPMVPVNANDFADPAIRKQWLREKGMLVLSFYDPIRPTMVVDLFTHYPTDFTSLLANASLKYLGGVPINVCSLDDLLKMKREAGRPRDLEDVRALEANRGK